uniref:hypothetical protein n=1 Tax=Corynebacterium glyciniphilum TaxID=1404244 RepID=UPI001642DA00
DDEVGGDFSGGVGGDAVGEGEEVSWLWEVKLEKLEEMKVVVGGEGWVEVGVWEGRMRGVLLWEGESWERMVVTSRRRGGVGWKGE